MARAVDLEKGRRGLYCSHNCKNTGEHNPNYKGGQLSNYTYKLRAVKKNPKRFQAMQEVQSALRNGSLTRKPCEECGQVVVEAHHDNYDKPLEVRWLCRYHHDEEHHG